MALRCHMSGSPCSLDDAQCPPRLQTACSPQQYARWADLCIQRVESSVHVESWVRLLS